VEREGRKEAEKRDDGRWEKRKKSVRGEHVSTEGR